MRRHAIFPALLSLLLGAATVPAAQAGSAINRCVDGAGRVTLTDQPCDAHTVSSTIAVPGTQEADQAQPVTVYSNAAAPVRSTPALRPVRWQATGAAQIIPQVTPYAALSGDMATLKQARARMLQDTASRTRLASLDR